MQPLIRRPRQLWNQVLYREVAATALTVKAGADALDMVRKLLSLDPACLQSASVDALRAPHPCHESLNHEGDKSGSLVVARVSQEHRKGVTAWKVAACSCWSLPPSYARTLTRWWQSSVHGPTRKLQLTWPRLMSQLQQTHAPVRPCSCQRDSTVAKLVASCFAAT